MIAPSPFSSAGSVSDPRASLFLWPAAHFTSLLICGVCALPNSSLAVDPTWWATDAADAVWTNKPLAQIQAAAEQGEAFAQYYCARACFMGQTGDQGPRQALLWTRRSADQGYAQASFQMARFYYTGMLVKRDSAEGFRWASRAAERGNPEAMGLVAQGYIYGDGTIRDQAKGLEWFQRAVKAGSRYTPNWMGDYYFQGEAATVKRTNYAAALYWYERAASNGLRSAAAKLADMYRKGLGAPPDFDRALHWIRVLADQDKPEMLEGLSGLYAAGAAEPRGPDDTPTELLRRAAVIRAIDLHYSETQPWSLVTSWALINTCRELWSRYRFGIGTPRDYVAAAQWMWIAYREDLRRVASGQDSVTYTEKPLHPFVAIINGESPPFTTDERLWQEAVGLVYGALDQRRTEAWYRIGECYRDGSALTPKQPHFAWGWFTRAVELGHAPAQAALQALEKTFTTNDLAKAKYFWVPPLAKNE